MLPSRPGNNPKQLGIKNYHWFMSHAAFLLILWGSCPAFIHSIAHAQAIDPQALSAKDSDGVGSKPLPSLIDEWSAGILPAKYFSIGSVMEIGIGSGLSAGIDPTAIAVGAKTLQLKWQIPRFGEDDWAIGLKYVNLSRHNMWWGDLDDYFRKLEAKVFRPSIAWSNRVSKHLIIHSFWASGYGRTEAELSEFGAAELARRKANSDGTDREYEIASKTMQFQSIAGLTEDRFQLTAEWERLSGERILLATRLERTKLKELETFSTRFTIAQHWTTDGLNLRLGAGPQYSILSGKDLDGREINATKWLPAADLAVYWIY